MSVFRSAWWVPAASGVLATVAVPAQQPGAIGAKPSAPAAPPAQQSAVRPYAPLPSRTPDRVTAAALEKFNDERFALFIHWGLYTRAGGIIRGKRYYGLAEWLMYNSKTPSAEYLRIADGFNPTAFDAREWVRIAKAAGVRYIVITTKHHDGFAMFNSKVSANTIVRRTPFARDPIAELAREAGKAGIGLGFYYSQYQDWTEPDGGGNTWEFDPGRADFERYFQRKVVPQVTELLTHYGPVREIWFDTPGPMKPDYSRRLYELVKSLQPCTLVNSRLGNGYGDYSSPSDSEVLPASLSRNNWEAIYPHNDSWGFSKFDTNFKSTDDLLTLLVLSVSRGGNFMLNVGPDELGRFPEATSRRLLAVGEWLRTYGESIYGTGRSPLPQQSWGVATTRGRVLYLHVMQRPDDNVLRLTGLSGARPLSARLMAGGQTLAIARDGEGWRMTLPADLPAAHITTVRVELDGTPTMSVDGPAQITRSAGRIPLEVADAVRPDGVRLIRADVHLLASDNRAFYTVDGLVDPSRALRWPVEIVQPGEYRLYAEYQATDAQKDREAILAVAGQERVFRIRPSADLRFGQPPQLNLQPVGIVRFERPGRHDVTLRAAAAGGELAAFRTVYLAPVD